MKCEADQTKPYSKGPYNKVKEGEQWIRLSEGCPNGCPYCREGIENPKLKVFDIPELKANVVKILDMNLLCHPEALEIIKELGQRKFNKKIIKYELLCGIDYRFLTPEIAVALKQSRFDNIRLAWDFSFGLQKKIKDAIQDLMNAGYRVGRRSQITIFMICNWKTSYEENMKKLELCKVWNVKVADCYFDNQLSPNIKPIHWQLPSILHFRRDVRKHNQLVNFGIDPEWKKKE